MKTKPSDISPATHPRDSSARAIGKKLSAFLLATTLLTTSMSALAGRSDERHGRHFQPGRHGQHFDGRPQYRPQYRPQHHRHDNHGHDAAWGVLGAGIALGALALTLEAPRPPVVLAPSVTTLPVRPAGQWWYFCESAGAYYPYVGYCAEGWRAVPATPY